MSGDGAAVVLAKPATRLAVPSRCFRIFGSFVPEKSGERSQRGSESRVGIGPKPIGCVQHRKAGMKKSPVAWAAGGQVEASMKRRRSPEGRYPSSRRRLTPGATWKRERLPMRRWMPVFPRTDISAPAGMPFGAGRDLDLASQRGKPDGIGV